MVPVVDSDAFFFFCVHRNTAASAEYRCLELYQLFFVVVLLITHEVLLYIWLKCTTCKVPVCSRYEVPGGTCSIQLYPCCSFVCSSSILLP